MGFRELSAWVMAILIALLGLFYINAIFASARALEAAPPPNVPLIAVTTVFLIIGAIVGHLVAVAIAPQDADAPEDERDKLIIWRAGNVSGWVLGSGVFVGLWHFIFQSDGNVLFHILVISLILAQLSEYVLKIVYYRRGV